MKHSIYYSPLAKSDLMQIRDYIRCHLNNPSAADNTIDGIFSAIELLETQAEYGSPLFYQRIATQYRTMRYKNNIVFYRFEETGVYIDRILYSKMDYLRILFD